MMRSKYSTTSTASLEDFFDGIYPGAYMRLCAPGHLMAHRFPYDFTTQVWGSPENPSLVLGWRQETPSGQLFSHSISFPETSMGVAVPSEVALRIVCHSLLDLIPTPGLRDVCTSLAEFVEFY